VQTLRNPGIQAEMQSVPAKFDLSVAVTILTVRVTVLAWFRHLSPLYTTSQLARASAE
jgi:hypothetical protein